MSVCRFYQQGRCKFGTECRNEHQGSSSFDETSYSTHSAKSHLQNDRYHYVRTTNQGINSDPKQQINQILENVRQDSILAEKGGQWPFSCYAPMKEYANVAGLDDISPEELRWLMYNSRETESFDKCAQQIYDMLQTVQMKWNVLKSSSIEAQTIIQSIFNKEGSTGTFESTPSVFGGSQPHFAATASIFGGPIEPSPTCSFSGSTPQPSIFGGSTNVLPPSGLFASAAASQNSAFFGQPSPTNPPSGLFGAAAAAVTNTTQHGSLFGGNETMQQSSIFGSSNAPLSTSIFGSHAVPQSASVFGNSNPGGTVFDSGQKTENQSFGTSKINQQSTFFQLANTGEANVSVNTENAVYSVMAELSEDMKAAFKAQIFVIGQVPIKPPPKEFCM